MLFYVKMFGISLGLTLLIETALAFLLFKMRGRSLVLVVLINCLTNPAAVLICYIAAGHLPAGQVLPFQLVIELIVVLIEGLIYRAFRGNGVDFRWPVLMSLILNGLSYGTGLLINHFQLIP